MKKIFFSIFVSLVFAIFAQAEVSNFKSLQCVGKDEQTGEDMNLRVSYDRTMTVDFPGSAGWKDDKPYILETTEGDLTVIASHGSYSEYRFDLHTKKNADGNFTGYLQYAEDDSGWRLGPFSGPVVCHKW